MISIIGAGPVGSYLAYLLSKKNVQVFEEHTRIGKPVQCTGLVTSHLKNIIKLDRNIIVNEISNIKIFSPKNKYVDLKLRKKDLVIDREKFDKYLYNMALEKGVKFYLNHKFIKKDGNFIKIKHNNKIKKFKTDILVGADGPNSSVAKDSNLFQNRKFLIGIQAKFKGNFNIDTFQVYLGSICPNFFGWVVPESDKIAKIGIASYKNPYLYFKKFIKKFKGKIISHEGGLIPIYNPKIKTSKENVFLVGDAATQVKASTGGGIIPGLLAAKSLASSFENYEKNWRKTIGNNLYLHLLIRKTLDKFSNEDYENLINLINNNVKKEIETYNREFPIKLLFKLIIKEPRFLKFIPKLF